MFYPNGGGGFDIIGIIIQSCLYQLSRSEVKLNQILFQRRTFVVTRWQFDILIKVNI